MSPARASYKKQLEFEVTVKQFEVIQPWVIPNAPTPVQAVEAMEPSPHARALGVARALLARTRLRRPLAIAFQATPKDVRIANDATYVCHRKTMPTTMRGSIPQKTSLTLSL